MWGQQEQQSLGGGGQRQDTLGPGGPGPGETGLEQNQQTSYLVTYGKRTGLVHPDPALCLSWLCVLQGDWPLRAVSPRIPVQLPPDQGANGRHW